MTPVNSKQVRRLKGGLIVSCQASDDSPMNRPVIIAAIARVAERQGAVAVRINGPSDILAVRNAVDIPIIGIAKEFHEDSPVYITPTIESVRRIARAGASIVALDCTGRRRPKGQLLMDVIRCAKEEFGLPVMADVATFKEGAASAELGADIIATTLHGYTRNTSVPSSPAFAFLRRLIRELPVPIILEGRVHRPEEVRKAFKLGAHAVVVGSAITNIEWLVNRFAGATTTARLLPGQRSPARMPVSKGRMGSVEVDEDGTSHSNWQRGISGRRG